MKTKAFALSALVMLTLSACSFEMSISSEETEEPGGPLYTIAEAINSGGMCPEGECTSEVKILSDGRVFAEDNTHNFVGSIADGALEDLKAAIKEIDVGSLPERGDDYTCPVAYDGQKTIFSFYGETDEPVVIDSCEYDPLGVEAVQIVERAWEDVVAEG